MACFMAMACFMESSAGGAYRTRGKMRAPGLEPQRRRGHVDWDVHRLVYSEVDWEVDREVDWEVDRQADWEADCEFENYVFICSTLVLQ